MNDFSEISYGINCLIHAYNSNDCGAKFQTIIERIYPGISGNIEKAFNERQFHLTFDTYVACFSQHDFEDDLHGKLSMWRAYGIPSGVALVLNGERFYSRTGQLGAYSSPVEYLDPTQFKSEFLNVADLIEKNLEKIKLLGRERCEKVLFNMFMFGAICTKHKAFKEEQEWRVIYVPSLWNSKHLQSDVVSVRGVPQQIFKIPLDGSTGLDELNLKNLLDRIIIGPCPYPLTIQKAFVKLLEEIGVSDPEKRVHLSEVPLRSAT